MATSFLVSGDAHFRVKKDIRITDIKMVGASSSGYETYGSEYYNDGTKMFVTLPNIDSTITYQVEVTNTSNDIYILKEINEILNSIELNYVFEIPDRTPPEVKFSLQEGS